MLLGRSHSATVSDPIYPFPRAGMISLLERGDGGDKRLHGYVPSWNSTLYHMRHVWPSNRGRQSVLHDLMLYVSKVCEPDRRAETHAALPVSRRGTCRLGAERQPVHPLHLNPAYRNVGIANTPTTDDVISIACNF
jgi:hypothetical protein